jgi:2-desacetyl-2-hydroxyethyl bacteriochlorophyllide A dehydrogenase
MAMRAVVCVEPGKLELMERPRPEIGAGLVAVDIKAIGICGTDFHIFEGTHPFLAYPRVMGHELSGIVAEAPASGRLRPGATVVVNPYLSCGICVACRKGRFNCCSTLKVLGVHIDGGMCERIVVPEGNLYPADDLSLRDAAMVEFLTIGAHAVARSEVQKGDRVLIVGAGPIGTGTAFFAGLAGGEVTIVDVSDTRVGTMRDLGFAQTIHANESALDEAKRQTSGDLFDVVFDATGSAKAMEASFAYVASGGTLVLVGVRKASISFDDPEFHRKEMKLLATRNALKRDFETVMAAMRAGKIPLDALNTHTDTLASLPKAMPAWLASSTPPLKAIVTV